MNVFSDIRSEERLVELWTRKVLSYLKAHGDAARKRRGSYLAKTSVQEDFRVIDKMLVSVIAQTK